MTSPAAGPGDPHATDLDATDLDATDLDANQLDANHLDTTDLRTGAPIADALLALLPLVGEWAGTGAGTKPATGEQFAYYQRITFAHDGRPFLAYESRTWLVDARGTVVRPAAREVGFWRPGSSPDDVEVVLALNTGLALILTGTAGDQQWDLTATTLTSAPTAKAVDAHRRFYAIVDDALVYAQELAPAGQALQPHLNARLARTSNRVRT